MRIKGVPFVLCLFFALKTMPSAYAENINSSQLPISRNEKINDSQTHPYQESGTIVVTAKRIPSRQNETAENVIVYAEEDIRQFPARDLGEVLSYIPVVDIQRNGQFGQSTAISINGLNARQVLLMVDGIPFHTQLSGQANPTQIPIRHINRIEIIKETSSSAWGSSLGVSLM